MLMYHLVVFWSCWLQKGYWMLSAFRKMCLYGQWAELVMAV